MRRAVFALLLVASTAGAQPAELTKEFQAGVDAYRLGKFDEARAHLEKARDIDPKLPGPYRFLSVVAQAQGRWSDCIDNAHQALVLNPRSTETEETKKVYDACRIGGGRAPYLGGDLGESAAIAVTTNVPGATVKVNGLSYGATPLAPRPITAGKLEIEIEKAGWKSTTFEVDALGGIVTDVEKDLEPDPNAQATDLQVHPTVSKVGWLTLSRNDVSISIDGAQHPPADRIELAPGTHVVELHAPGKDMWHRRVRVSAGQKVNIDPQLVDSESRANTERRGFYALGAGGVLLVGGFITAMVSRDALAEAKDIVRIETARDPSQPLSVSGQVAPVRTRADLEAAHDKANRFALISDVSYGAGLVAVGVGAYYLYRGARERTDVPPPFAIAPTHGGLFVAKELAW